MRGAWRQTTDVNLLNMACIEKPKPKPVRKPKPQRHLFRVVVDEVVGGPARAAYVLLAAEERLRREEALYLASSALEMAPPPRPPPPPPFAPAGFPGVAASLAAPSVGFSCSAETAPARFVRTTPCFMFSFSYVMCARWRLCVSCFGAGMGEGEQGKQGPARGERKAKMQ